MIERMTEKDVAQILGLERSFFLTPWSKESFLSAVQDPLGINLICKVKGKVIGYVTSFMVLEEAYITNLLVERSHRRRGYATAMLHRVAQEVTRKKGKHLLLEVREGNFGAISFYREMNFRLIGVRKNYYAESQEDALLMELSLVAD